MEISCPSCGVKHQSEDYPGAFEINCVCGYSILLPDEDALKMEPEPPRFNDPPLSMDAGAESFTPDADASEKSDTATATEVPPEEAVGALSLTPPDALPTEMPYDPYELNQSSQAIEAPPVLKVVERQGSSVEKKKQSPAQAIVHRVQRASLKQFLGGNFDLKLEDLSAEALADLLKRVEGFLKDRLWLQQELESNGVNLKGWKLSDWQRGVPELLAVEIYLLAFELGGNCEFTKSLS